MSSVHVELDTAYVTFRTALIHVLQTLKVDPVSGTSIAQSLKLNRQLSWQLASIGASTRTPDGLLTLPGKVGLEILLEACDRAIADNAASDPQKGLAAANLGSAIQALESVIERCASDRTMLTLIAAAWDQASVERRSLELRRSAFRAQSAMVGACVQAQLRGICLLPARSGDPTKFTIGTYQSYRRLTRLRAGHASTLAYVEFPCHNDGRPDHDLRDFESYFVSRFQFEPSLSSIDASSVEHVVSSDHSRGWVVLRPGPLGESAATQVSFTGESRYEVPRFTTSDNHLHQMLNVCQIPTQTLYLDCLIDSRLEEASNFLDLIEVYCLENASGEIRMPMGRQDPSFLFHVAESTPISVESSGINLEFPQSTDLIRRLADRMGADPRHLVGRRYRIEYIFSPLCAVIERRLLSPQHVAIEATSIR